jgi:hypothetical protein
MGLISSIFGERPSTPQTGGFTVGAEIPKELAPFYKDILGKSQALYNESVAQGYKPYTGPSLAEFTPEQQQAFTGISGLQGQQAPVYQEAMGMTRDAAAPITTEEITEYMNPYQQAVVDIEKREATKQYESQVQPQLAAKAAMIQPFGGSRQAILEGMAADTQQRLLGDIQAKGSAQAYQDAVNLLTEQRGRTGSGAGQLATMGSNLFKSQLGEIGALQTVGEEKQQLSQQALNEAYGQYLKEQEYPYQQLGRYQSVVTGAPIQGTTYVPPTPPGPSVGQQLLGGAATMLGTYGAFGGKMPSLFGTPATAASGGGGIAGLPVLYSQENGGIGERLKNIALPPRYLYKKGKEYLGSRFDRFRHNISGYNYLEDKPDVTQEKTYFRNPSENPIWQEEDRGILSILKNKAKDVWGNIQDKVTPGYPGYLDKQEMLKRRRSTDQEPSYFRDPSENPIWQEDNRGILSILKNKVKDVGKKYNKFINRGDKKVSEIHDRILKEREKNKINPFLDKNRPPMYLEKEDVRPDSPAKQDIEKAVDFGGRIIGTGVDLLNMGNNWINKNMNNLLKIGETYVLKPGDESGLTELPIRTNEEARILFNKYNFGGRDIPTTKEEQERISEEINIVDLRPGHHEGLIVEAEKIIEDPSIITNSNAVNKIKELYLSFSFPKLRLNSKDAEEKTKKILMSPVPDEDLTGKDEKIKSTITTIVENKTPVDNKINKDESKALKAQVDYSNLITKKDKGDKVPKTALSNKQDEYLAAVKKMNDGLDKKDALIGKAQQESFWAFVARVGANISKGTAISESVASELPQAMKDRQSLIQAKSDLADKKLSGKVDVAKAGLDIESSRVKARVAAEREAQDIKEKKIDQHIDYLKAVTKDPSLLKAPSSSDIDFWSDNAKRILKNIGTKKDDLKITDYFSGNINIPGIGKDNAQDIYKFFDKISTNKDFMKDMTFELKNNKVQYVGEGYDQYISKAIQHVLNSGKYRWDSDAGYIFKGKVKLN